MVCVISDSKLNKVATVRFHLDRINDVVSESKLELSISFTVQRVDSITVVLSESEFVVVRVCGVEEEVAVVTQRQHRSAGGGFSRNDYLILRYLQHNSTAGYYSSRGNIVDRQTNTSS